MAIPEELPLTDTEKLMVSCGINPRALSKQSPLQDELVLLIGALGRAAAEGVDPLTFWAVNEKQFKIWSSIAARVFATMASSTDAERFFKTTKAICADHRSLLSPDMVNIYSSLYVWLTDENYCRHSREAIRTGKSNRFTTLSADLQMIVPADEDSEDDDDIDDDNDEKEEEVE